jgi:hypothetical protein
MGASITVSQSKEIAMKTSKLLAVVLVLQGLTLLGQWTGAGYVTSAQAQIPDPANRQMQMVEELRNLNSKMDQLLGILKDGEVQVKVAKSDDAKGSGTK